ncbi:hypothetical protein Q9L58_000907 [Maublancomyces gigas]|uniref:DUF7907 domain-containing protein n=1 Tax=Discina gigas TaxID=1032678 RepID=A0ABR3GVZ0_9PEZI
MFAGLISTALAAVNTTQEFYVRSQVISGPAKFADLYLSVYHTGAGMNDLTLAGKDIASKAFINSTQLQWDLGTPDIPWGISLTSAANYVAWQSITVNAGYGDTG